MMFMTARVDLKKILLILGIIAAVIAGILWITGGDEDVTTAAPSVGTNEGRVKFLQDFGWEVAASPVESSQVKIPKESSEVFERYNNLQKSQGYDLSRYAGKNVMRFVYKITNYPGATEPVYATLLVHKDQVIGGDITDTAAKGQIRGFKMPAGTEQTAPSETAATP
ncbi:MAG: DUF4830 domain-containing protein [Ruminococcaceae bacterium]|nr:DUF4830 domain-containing protein [Oscillospiraceae bacterium]